MLGDMNYLTSILLLLALAASLSAADPVTSVPKALAATAHKDFLALSEVTLIGVIAKPAVQLPEGGAMTVKEYLTKAGATDPGFAISDATADALVLRASPDRLLLARVQTVYVRASAIAVIDDRAGGLYAFAPMPAPGTDGKGTGLIPMPEAIGVSVAAGTGRIFCGVRTGRMVDPNATKGITQADVSAVATLMSIPSPPQILKLLSP